MSAEYLELLPEICDYGLVCKRNGFAAGADGYVYYSKISQPIKERLKFVSGVCSACMSKLIEVGEDDIKTGDVLIRRYSSEEHLQDLKSIQK